MTAHVNYGPIKPGKEYKIVGEGYDWYAVKVRGGIFHVPQWVFTLDKFRRV